MQKRVISCLLPIGLAIAAIASCNSKSTEPSNIIYVATLSGANERPNANTSTATGTWTGTLNPNTNVMTYTLTYTGLSGSGSGAHIHAQADASGTANVVLNFATFSGATTAFTNGNTSGTAAGTVNMAGGTTAGFTITGDSLRKAMDAGMAYANVHSTPNFGGGEIRGQIHRQ